MTTKRLLWSEEFTKFKGYFFRMESVTSKNQPREEQSRSFKPNAANTLCLLRVPGYLSTTIEDFKGKSYVSCYFHAPRDRCRTHKHSPVPKPTEPLLFLRMLINNPSLLISCCPFSPSLCIMQNKNIIILLASFLKGMHCKYHKEVLS